MTDRDLEIIRSLDAGEVEQIVAALASDCVYHEDPHWLDGRVFNGRDEVRDILNEYREVWGTYSQEVEEVERVGRAVVATIRQSGVTPKGEMPYEQVWTYVFDMHDGQIAEMWAFANAEEARAQAAAL